ncbi:MAG: GNAT family N-acetyltransferase [Cyanothece sp. SIO1E1]|nr:GNAT family N-acetyltransferase [Cyanothece sp. SIO1E1]
MLVTLREITADTVRSITDLAVRDDQQGFVASNAVSLAQALFQQEAWYRAIYYGDLPAGFVMLYDETLRPVPPAQPEVFLWRFMVDANFQGQGIGKAALGLVIAHVRSKGVFASIATSYVPAPGSPEGFYLSQGFHHTGKMEDDEVVLELLLEPDGV